MEKTVILRKTKKKNNLFQNGTIYKSRTRNFNSDPIEGSEEPYNGQSIIGSTENITPHWDNVAGKWAFDGTLEDLKAIQKRLKLRERKEGRRKDNSPKFSGDLIEIREDELFDTGSPFFNHKYLWVNSDLIIHEGSHVISSDTGPLEELMIRIYNGRRRVKNSSKKQSPADVYDARYELEVPRLKTKAKREDVDKAVDAVIALKKLSEPSRLKIASILDPSGYSDTKTDSDEIYTVLYENVVLNTDTSDRIGGNVWQDEFLSLAEKPAGELTVADVVMRAKRAGGIRARKTGYVDFTGEVIDKGRIKTDKQLISYFLKDTSTKEYEEIKDWLINNTKYKA